jgi:uncharacterized protein YfkK (UPF0435 family)
MIGKKVQKLKITNKVVFKTDHLDKKRILGQDLASLRKGLFSGEFTC